MERALAGGEVLRSVPSVAFHSGMTPQGKVCWNQLTWACSLTATAETLETYVHKLY